MGLHRALRADRGAAPWLVMVQRRYPTQRAQPIVDARLEFDLRTALTSWGKGSKVKPQSEWLDASIESFLAKRSNLQLAVGAIFPYRVSKTVGSEKLLDLVEATWIACRPLADALLGKGQRWVGT